MNMYPFHSWINKLFSEENNVPRKLLEAREVAGSATYKQSGTVEKQEIQNQNSFIVSQSGEISLPQQPKDSDVINCVVF